MEPLSNEEKTRDKETASKESTESRVHSLFKQGLGCEGQSRTSLPTFTKKKLKASAGHFLMQTIEVLALGGFWPAKRTHGNNGVDGLRCLK